MPGDLPQAAAVRLSQAIDALEAQRRRAAEATVVICGQIVVLALVWGVAPIARGHWSPGGIFTAAAAMLGARFLLGLSENLWRSTANRIVVPILAETLGGMTARLRSRGPALDLLPAIGALLDPDVLFDLDPAFELGLLPRRSANWADWRLDGEHRSLAFTMAAIVQRWNTAGNKPASRRSDHVLLSIVVPVPFQGRVLIARDGGVFEAIADHLTPLLDTVLSRPDSPQRLQAPYEAFERRFTVRADDPAEAQRLVIAAVAEGLVAIDEAHPDRSVRAAFHRGRLWLALDLAEPMLQQVSLLRPAPAMMAQLQEMLGELGLPHRLIDYLHGRPPA
ncbi:DUF3137 domain-containing protein [Inquilinus limosus]|uniref:Uncharacterized protein n=1 Tax=Inquilinus limosus MP06 TaxID=1398085 RepID=A0A0A0D5S9_9PROT|nr:DUF3137 domain-containing protein [Inquilinus limosus]KGM33405.1 hypothetical protein P409_16030 [Inquilinus limosus MP06]